MSDSAATSQPRPASEPLLPPEPRFWRRYSPHHEFSVSAFSSLTAHVLLMAVVVGAGYLAVRWGWNGSRGPLAVQAVAVDVGRGSGGGDVGPREAAGEANDAAPPPTVARETLPEIRRQELSVPPLQAPAGRVEDVMAAFGPLGRSKQPPGRPSGVPRISSEQKNRLQRWRLTFKTQNGDDYRKQLLALGAILAVPRGENRYLVIRDLAKRPAAGKVEDLAGIGRIFWVDDRPESVKSLARALRLANLPAYFVAFFPRELEEKLLRKELAFKNRKEQEIKETAFELEKRGDAYEPVVVAQY